MHTKFFTLIILISSIIACTEEPNLSQTIEYLEHKIDNTTVYGQDETFINDKFKIDGNKVLFIEVSKIPSDDFELRRTFEFPLDDIVTIAGGTDRGLGSVEIRLSKNSGILTRQPLNEHTASVLQEMGETNNESVDAIRIKFEKRDIDEIRKAFFRIIDIIEENRGDAFFE